MRQMIKIRSSDPEEWQQHGCQNWLSELGLWSQVHPLETGTKRSEQVCQEDEPFVKSIEPACLTSFLPQVRTRSEDEGEAEFRGEAKEL